MKKIIYPLAILLMASCSDESNKNEQKEGEGTAKENNDSTQTAFKEDSVDIESEQSFITYEQALNSPLFYSLEDLAILQEYFGDTLTIQLDSNQYNISNAKTDKELLAAYKIALTIKDKLVNRMFSLNLPYEIDGGGWYPDYVIQKLQPIDKASIGLQTSCVAECTEFSFTFYLTELEKKAIETSGKLDDEFFNLLMDADVEMGGDGIGYHTWFARTWDYGGGTLLGDSLHYNFLVKMNEFQQKYSALDELLKRYKDDILRDINHGIYMNTKEEVMAEMKMILGLNFITAQEKEPIQLLYNKFEKDEIICDNCPGGSYQFGCEDFEKNCNWGG